MARWRKQFRKFRRNLPNEIRENFDLALSAFLKEDRRQTIRRSSNPSVAASSRLSKRAALRKRAAVLRAVYGRGKRKTISEPELLLYRSKPDILRDTLSPRFSRNSINFIDRLRKGQRAKVDLENFSFSRNPRGTLGKMRQIARLASTASDIRLNFSDETCDDVAPYIVLAHLLRSLPPIFSGGTINKEVTAVVKSVGLDRALGIGRILAPPRDTSDILPFKMVTRAPPGYFGDQDHQLRPQYKEYVADRFCQALENWLSTSEYELTPNGAQLIVSAITEALDNAERHGHPQIDDGMGDWSMAGFSRLVEEDDGNQRLDCSVSIVSIGSTVSESLATAGPNVRKRIEEYVNPLARDNTSDKELLRTVAALQDGVTRVSSASAADRGGVGLLTLVDFFADLGETDRTEFGSVFTILSGKSCLRMSDNYRRGIPVTKGGMRELWLNPANDVSFRPDSNHAFNLEDRFSGTILSACFSIDRAFLRKALAA